MGFCERANCGAMIKYVHEIYHPDWGHKNVGSTCVEWLTQKDKWISQQVMNLYKGISKFVHNSAWQIGYTKAQNQFIHTNYKYHQIRIYGQANYSFQIVLKERGRNKYDWRPLMHTKGKTLAQVKEMAYVVMKGLTCKDEAERDILRSIFKSMK